MNISRFSSHKLVPIIRMLGLMLLIVLSLYGKPAFSRNDITDLGALANRSLKASPAGAVIRMPREGVIRSTIHIGIGQTLVFPYGRWHCKAAPCIVLHDGAELVGAGIWRTQLLLDNATGPLVQSLDYTRLAALDEAQLAKKKYPLVRDRKSLPGVKYFKIKEMTLDGGNAAKASKSERPANGVELYGFWYWMENVSIERMPGHGLVTQFIANGEVQKSGNDAMESHFTNVKLLSNGGNGWLMRGPHDSIASGMIVANNGAWGIDLQHKEGHYSGGGLMLSNTHLYGNEDGLRTEKGANLVAYGLESEANKGIGLLLRSNDSLVQGLIYANGRYGVVIGQGDQFAAVNHLLLKVHNNKIAQIKWENSGGYNLVNASVYPNDDKQKFFEGKPTLTDQVLTAGPNAVQHFSGGVSMDSTKNMYGVKIK